MKFKFIVLFCILICCKYASSTDGGKSLRFLAPESDIPILYNEHDMGLLDWGYDEDQLIKKIRHMSELAPDFPVQNKQSIYAYNIYSGKVYRQRKGPFLVMVNPGRKSKRKPAEYKIKYVIPLYEPPEKMFHFGMALQKEAVFIHWDPRAEYDLQQPVVNIGGMYVGLVHNINPFAEAHFLMVPFIRPPDSNTQSLVTQDIALRSFAMYPLYCLEHSKKRNLKITFNSLGAGRSVDNFHHQAFYYGEGIEIPPLVSYHNTNTNLKNDSSHLPLEMFSRIRVYEKDLAFIERVNDYPLEAIFIGGRNHSLMADLLYTTVLMLRISNIPYNLIYSKSSEGVFIIPRKWDTDVELPIENMATFGVKELAGELTVFDESVLSELNEKNIRAFISTFGIPKETVNLVVQSTISIISQHPSVYRISEILNKNNLYLEIGKLIHSLQLNPEQSIKTLRDLIDLFMTSETVSRRKTLYYDKHFRPIHLTHSA